MDSQQRLFYALGEMAYAIACADGKLQEPERKVFEKILKNHLDWHVGDFDYAGVIFKILQKDKNDIPTVYKWAMKEMEMNKHHLTIQMINSFIDILKEVAAAFPPVTPEEKQWIDRFVTDIRNIGPHA